MHTNDRPYSCSSCGKSWRNRVGLAYHLKNELCRKKGKAKPAEQVKVALRDNHKETVCCSSDIPDIESEFPKKLSENNTNENPNKTCAKNVSSFTSKKKLKCNHCPKTFRYKSCLKAHSLSHGIPEKVKTFRCPKCPKTFTRKAGLADHVTLHTGVKPYKVNSTIRGMQNR
jgi:KRAB domain-containing zinc finger protein